MQEKDFQGVKRAMTELDERSIRVSEVGPFLGIVTQAERMEALQPEPGE